MTPPQRYHLGAHGPRLRCHSPRKGNTEIDIYTLGKRKSHDRKKRGKEKEKEKQEEELVLEKRKKKTHRKRENGFGREKHSRILQEEGRVEEAPNAHQSVPPRPPWLRYRRCRLRHLPRRRADLQSRRRSFFPLSLSLPLHRFFLSLISLQVMVEGGWEEVTTMALAPFLMSINKLLSST
ncbi:uncharacterized protein LOC107465633 [Arachis duranensis]|uniref:Uncharacterized protein LOC107465633 n=1 Tax=Arachis duranensis TaxID=130453 RepID=A0A9C6WN04_ARADU|nr:uncharacterized protein LOC107465633 [Arachis duranensis]